MLDEKELESEVKQKSDFSETDQTQSVSESGAERKEAKMVRVSAETRSADLEERFAESTSGQRSFPGDIRTEPSKQLVFNSPFSEKNNYLLRVTNVGAHRIGWAIKTNNINRLSVIPPYGVLNRLQWEMLTVSCEPLDYEKELTDRDRITVVWTDAPDAESEFCAEWLTRDDGMICRKNIAIQYNP